MKEVSYRNTGLYKCGTGRMHFRSERRVVYKYWVSIGLPFKVCSVCVFDSSWVGLYLTGSWWSLFVRLCLCAFIILNQELFSTAYTVHTMSHINWMRMRRLIGHFYANIYFG